MANRQELITRRSYEEPGGIRLFHYCVKCDGGHTSSSLNQRASLSHKHTHTVFPRPWVNRSLSITLQLLATFLLSCSLIGGDVEPRVNMIGGEHWWFQQETELNYNSEEREWEERRREVHLYPMCCGKVRALGCCAGSSRRKFRSDSFVLRHTLMSRRSAD